MVLPRARLSQTPEGLSLSSDRHATWPRALHCHADHSQSKVFHFSEETKAQEGDASEKRLAEPGRGASLSVHSFSLPLSMKPGE